MKDEFLIKVCFDEQGEEIEKIISNVLLKKLTKILCVEYLNS